MDFLPERTQVFGCYFIVNSSRNKSHCVKSVHIRSFSGPHFPVFRTNTRKYGAEKLPIRTRFTQCRNSDHNQILKEDVL